MSVASRGGLALVLGSLLLLSGCSIGPNVIRNNMQRYNEAVTETENEQFLNNIVRFRYRDTPKSLVVGSITSAYSLDATGPTSFPIHSPPHFTYLLAAQARLSDAPTVSITPLNGGDFHAGLITPVPLGSLVGLANMGWDLDRLLRVLVSDMNGVENVPHIAGKGHEVSPQFAEFASVAQTLARLQHAGLLQLTTDPVPVPDANVSESLKVEEDKVRDLIHPVEMLNAANSHYVFHYDPLAKTLTLKSTVTAYDLTIANEAWANCGLPETARLLKLAPGQPSYRLLSADTLATPLHTDGQTTDIVVHTRNIIGAMLYLSKGVSVPEQHYKDGLVAVSVDEQGQPFDWARTTEGLFRVCVQKCKPKNAFVATKYRGYWYYIADNDLNSKSTFDLVLQMYDFQISRGATSSPVLTVPVSAGGGRRGG